MADFRLTDEQKQYQQLAREFAQREIAGRAAQFDLSGEFPAEILRKAWELGLLNRQIGEAYGGLGLPRFESSLIAEEIGAACTAFGAAAEANGLAQEAVILGGNEEQKRELLTPFAEQCLFAACAVSEHRPASELAAMRTTARRAGQEYVISGVKTWVVNATAASWFFVLARTDGDGISAFIVDRDTEGVSLGSQDMTLGLRAAGSREVIFREARVSRRCLLGAEGKGAELYNAALDRARPALAALSVGLARSALKHAAHYSQERTTFGQAIANYQAVSFMIADMAKDIEAARLLAWQAAWLADRGQPNHRDALVARSFAAETALRAATDAVQIFGGYGYSREYPVEKLMRDAKVLEIWPASAEAEKLVLGRSAVGVAAADR